VHHWQAPVVVEIDANAQIDLVWSWIFLKILVQGKDRVAGIGIDKFEYGVS